MRIGPYTLANNLILAPMAGVTDRPYRLLCRRLGAGMAVSEMISSNALLWNSAKTQRRICHADEGEPRAVQIVGADPRLMAQAARLNAEHSAQIIDINMGCPAKKICNTLAGSALLRDEKLVGAILDAVVKAVDIPVTLKIRTGWDPDNRNALTIARIAEDAGIQALTIHGRTRACGFRGEAEYDTIAAVKAAIKIPVIANGDIDTPEKAKQVLSVTGADAVMIGRAAQGRPWIFREVQHYLATGERLPEPELTEVRDLMLEHLQNLYAFYGDYIGVRVARKHIAWYTKGCQQGAVFRQHINQVEGATEQLEQTRDFFDRLITTKDLAA
ncbi:MAG: tRNA dihydrouridine synthase DusB [Pseudomonadota bacterium]